jgi:single-stranded-DNA-specific exonuclease
MNYKLIEGSLNDIYNPKETVLLNRGIENYEEYLNLTDDVLHHFSLLENINEAVKCLLEHIENNDEIHIIVDCDCDGYCSAAILYRYLKLFNPEINLSYSIHTGKQHGISDDIDIPENVKLLIIPDAGTNDSEQCKTLQEKGIDIIILDHHQQDKDNLHAVVVNNQTCGYPNKSLCGAGVVYKFLQAIDEETWNSYHDNFIDLVALANIGDSMDIRSFETKRLIDKGLNKIRSKFLKALIEKQSYSMGNDITINNIQFYIVPLINAMVRAGDYDEKEMMFRAFIETDETFKYKPKRKSKDDPEPEEINETIYDRVARLCVNAKQRQNRSKDDSIEKICEFIDNNGLNNNKILFVNCTTLLDKNLTGVTAMQTANYYSKPCLMLRETENKETKEMMYEGSARNINNSYIPDLKAFLEETGLFEYCAGHANSLGVGLKKENVKPAIKLINDKLKDVDCVPCHLVDFIIDSEDLNIRFVREIDILKDIWGCKIEESKLVINNIVINKNNIQIMGKNNDTWKFIFNDEINFIKFKNDENDIIFKWMNDWENEDENISINILGRCNMNNFGGILSPQIIVLDYEKVNYNG